MSRFFSRIFDTSSGGVFKLFVKWRSLPEVADKALLNRCNKFEHSLFNFADKALKTSFNKLKSQLDEGDNYKKRSIFTLIAKTESTQKKLFTRWENTVKQEKQILKCRYTIQFCETLQHAFSLKFADSLQFKHEEDSIV